MKLLNDFDSSCKDLPLCGGVCLLHTATSAATALLSAKPLETYQIPFFYLTIYQQLTNLLQLIHLKSFFKTDKTIITDKTLQAIWCFNFIIMQQLKPGQSSLISIFKVNKSLNVN